MYKQELYHHGVKGMKWGVRRSRKQTGGTGTKKRKRYRDYGKKMADKYRAQKTSEIISSTATVASGALRVASILMVGEAALAVGTAATVATALAGAVTATNKIVSSVDDLNTKR